MLTASISLDRHEITKNDTFRHEHSPFFFNALARREYVGTVDIKVPFRSRPKQSYGRKNPVLDRLCRANKLLQSIDHNIYSQIILHTTLKCRFEFLCSPSPVGD